MLFKTVTVNCSTRIYFPVLHGMRDFPKWLHWWVCLVHSLYLSETLITQVFKVLCQSLYNCLFLCFACSPPLPQHLWTLLTASPAPLLSSSFLLRRFEFLKVWFVLCSYSIAARSSFPDEILPLIALATLTSLSWWRHLLLSTTPPLFLSLSWGILPFLLFVEEHSLISAFHIGDFSHIHRKDIEDQFPKRFTGRSKPIVELIDCARHNSALWLTPVS